MVLVPWPKWESCKKWYRTQCGWHWIAGDPRLPGLHSLPQNTHLGDFILVNPVEAELTEVKGPGVGPRSPHDDEVGDF